jgi:hypothetical protein
MFIETRFYDNGSAEARLTKHRPQLPTADHSDKYDYYVDEIDDLQGWIDDNLLIETDDIINVVIALNGGKLWVDVTPYI